jgi:hypothetical protein
MAHGWRLRLLRRRLRTSFPRRPWLAKARVACSAIRHQLRIDLWQRLAGARRLRHALHDGVDTVHLQASPLASRASNESRAFAGGRDLSARPLIASRHGAKRYGQPDAEHTERADWHHVAHHHRSRLNGSGQDPLFVAQTCTLVHAYCSGQSNVCQWRSGTRHDCHEPKRPYVAAPGLPFTWPSRTSGPPSLGPTTWLRRLTTRIGGPADHRRR